jgi:hypothetical protein
MVAARKYHQLVRNTCLLKQIAYFVSVLDGNPLI